MTFASEKIMFEFKSDRTADKEVYRDKSLFTARKEIHKKIIEIIGQYFKNQKDVVCLDAGCASGAFLSLLLNTLSHLNIKPTGLDIHDELLKMLKEEIPSANTIVGSILDTSLISESYNLITCLGTFSIFDDFEEPFFNLYNNLKTGGLMIISTEFNNFPIDVIMRYRDARFESSNWERGWNIFSKKSVENFLLRNNVEFEWMDFTMPYARAPMIDDPMRSWTIKTENNPFQQVNGAQQLINQSILKIERR